MRSHLLYRICLLVFVTLLPKEFKIHGVKLVKMLGCYSRGGGGGTVEVLLRAHMPSLQYLSQDHIRSPTNNCFRQSSISLISHAATFINLLLFSENTGVSILHRCLSLLSSLVPYENPTFCHRLCLTNFSRRGK